MSHAMGACGVDIDRPVWIPYDALVLTWLMKTPSVICYA